MYLVSAYFDDKANQQIQHYIEQTARKSGNMHMIEGHIPPHLTLSAFEGVRQEQMLKTLTPQLARLPGGRIQWVSVGTFLPYVLYIAPVLNEDLHSISSGIYQAVIQMEGISVSKYYRPFQWMPHTTIAKKLSKEEMLLALEAMQNQFVPFYGQITQIGIAKTNPYTDLALFELKGT